MTVGERVIVSKDDGRSWAVAVGYVRSSSPETISIMIDRFAYNPHSPLALQ